MTLQEQKEQKAVDYLRRQIDFGNPEVVLRVYKQVLTQGLFETQVGLGFLRELRDFLLRSPEISPADVPVLAGAEPDAEVYATGGDASTGYAAGAGGTAQNAAGYSAEGNSGDNVAGNIGATGLSRVSAAEGEDAVKAEEDRQALEQAATREAIRREAQRIVRRERDLSREYRNKMYKALVGVVICVIAMIAMLVITLTSNLPTIINYRTKIVDEYSTWEKELNEREEALREYEESLDQKAQGTGGGSQASDESGQASGNDQESDNGQGLDDGQTHEGTSQESGEAGSLSTSDEPLQEIEVNDDDLAPIDQSLFEQ